MTDDQHRSATATPPAADPSLEPALPPSAAPRRASPASPSITLEREVRDGGPGVSAHAAFTQPHRVRSAWQAIHTPAAALAVSLTLTAVAASLVTVAARDRDTARFSNDAQAARDRVQTRVDTYTALLHGAQALFAASEQVQAHEFRTYVEQLELGTRYKGIQGIGFSRLLDPPGARSDSASIAAALRAGGSEAARRWSLPRTAGAPPAEGAEAEHHAIVYLEPLDRRNRAALGFDMYSEPTRRAAMDRARDLGRPAASDPVTLVQEIDADKQAGFLIYVPVYALPPDTRLESVAERRRALRGFVYAPVRARDFFSGTFGSERVPRVAFRVFAGRDTTAAALLFDSRDLVPAAVPARSPWNPGVALRRTDTVAVAGQVWTLAFAPTAASGIEEGSSLALWILAAGTAVGVALYYATRAEFEARRAAERSDALRTRFFAAMSHELRTPINAIMGYNDLILAGIYGPVSEEQQRGLERSQRAARHLLELVNDVLDVSKLESGKVEVASEDVALDEFLEDLLVTIRPMAEERGCVLHLERGTCAITFRTDPRRLRQILLNLLSNATKFAAGQLVTVWCEALPHGSAVPGSRRGSGGGGRRWTGGDAVVVAVRDDGPGIAPADHERIFEEFVQLPGTTPGGTGLGLPISRRLAELLGGTLTVESAAGRGSTFYVTLPRVPRRERTSAHG
jgi:signal transduction histidine kinase